MYSRARAENIRTSSSLCRAAAFLFVIGCVNLTPPGDHHAANPEAGRGGAIGGTTGTSDGESGTGDDVPTEDAPAQGGAGGAGGGAGDGPWSTSETLDAPLPDANAGHQGGAGGNSTRTGGSGGRAFDADVDAPMGGAGGTDATPGGKGGSSAGGSDARTTVSTGGLDGGTGGVSTPGLVAYYTCDQTTGPTLVDSSGNRRDGALVTGTGGSGYSFANGLLNDALTFVAANKGYAALPADLLSDATEMTIATWVFLNTSVAWQRVWDFGSGPSVYMFLSPRANYSQKPRFGISLSGTGTEQGLDGTVELPVGVWKHMAVVLNGEGGSLYVDGALVTGSAGITLRPSDLGATKNDYIGRSQFSTDPYFDGRIDDFRVYNRALTAAEIAALFTYRGH